MIRIERAFRDDFLDFGDHPTASGCYHRVEISRGLLIDEIASGISAPCLDDCQIGAQPALANLGLALDTPASASAALGLFMSKPSSPGSIFGIHPGSQFNGA